MKKIEYVIDVFNSIYNFNFKDNFQKVNVNICVFNFYIKTKILVLKLIKLEIVKLM